MASEHQGLQASSDSDAQQKRNWQTIYLEPDLDDRTRAYIIQERKRVGYRVEINEAARLFMESKNS